MSAELKKLTDDFKEYFSESISVCLALGEDGSFIYVTCLDAPNDAVLPLSLWNKTKVGEDIQMQ